MMELFKTLAPGADSLLKRQRSACGNRFCHNTQLMRGIPGSRPGVSVGQAWYCGIDCFVATSCTTLERLSGLKVLERACRPRFSLGLFLLSKGFLTAEQLRTATSESHCLNEDIEEILSRRGLVTEKRLAAARSAQWGYPMLAPGFVWQTVEVDIPKSLLRVCRAVPLHYSAAAKRILIGFSERVEHGFIELIEEVTHCRVEPCIITPADFVEQMERLASPPDYEEVVGEAGTSEKMARAAGRAAIEISATDATFGKWRNFVLVRLEGKRGRADVAFQLSHDATVEIDERTGEFNEAIAV